MSKFSRKSAAVLGAVLGVCAFVVPSMAAAASWGPLNTTHILTSANLAFSSHLLAGLQAGSSCADSRLVADVSSAAVLTVTGATFSSCVGTGGAAGCTATATVTNLNWSATGPTTANIQIHRMDIDVVYETRAGQPCLFEDPNVAIRMTGTLNGGAWTGNAAHTIDFFNDSGLFTHTGALGGGKVTTVTGSFIDVASSGGLLTLS